ncbi:6238_t:CDS:2 [Funneliformis caledonium]|uniref:6238_t:CDS:1 n=1 Tax=Funneliformis caledonium TaxID=1117310 RepID=A0A9N9N147_9GLOM|nr:6238_t:CDS:2 [Funneliformis caledonium]
MKRMLNTTTTSTAAYLRFCSIDNTRLEELTVYSYDIRLKEKRNTYSIKDIILIDLQENNLYGLNVYIKAINAIVDVPSL